LDNGVRYSEKIASLTDRHYHTVSFLPNKTANIMKENWNPKSKTSSLGVNIAPPFPYFEPKGPENPFKH